MIQVFLIWVVGIIISCNDQIKEPEPQIIADFEWELDSVNYYQVKFTNTSSNSIRFSWDFGNGDTSNLENPTYTYTNGGIYDVSLKAYGAGGKQSTNKQSIVLYDIPTPPISMLSGKESKTWKLYRIGSSVSLGPNSSQPDSWWKGFYNDGTRNCLYKHEFIFYADKTFEFKDYGGFWGDLQIWPPEAPIFESCFEPSASNMMVNDTSLTAWLSGTHSYDFNSSNGSVVLSGKGAWMGFPFLGTTGNHGINMPDSVSFTVSLEQKSTFDLMTINFDYGEDGFWTFVYVSYHEWQDEPPLVE